MLLCTIYNQNKKNILNMTILSDLTNKFKKYTLRINVLFIHCRNGDIILSVNDEQVKSAAMVANMLQRIVKYSKNSKLRMVSKRFVRLQ